MEKVYIISRYRANSDKELKFNQMVARYFCRQIVEEGNAPVAPHLFYTQFLDDEYEADREIGTYMGLVDLSQCQEFLLVIVDGIISEGMNREIQEVSRLGIPGRIIAMTRAQISEAMKVVI